MSRRRPSIGKALHDIETDPAHHLTGPFLPGTPLDGGTPVDSSNDEWPAKPVKNGHANGKRAGHAKSKRHKYRYVSSAGYQVPAAFRWMISPKITFQLLCIPIVLYFNWNWICPQFDNPFSHIIFISNPIPDSPPDNRLYTKSYSDLAFIAYYTIFFLFVRQSLTTYILYPLARLGGIKREGKVERFGEQGYAVVYFSITTVAGLLIQKDLPTWFYKTEHFWIDYPHWRLSGLLKSYYLLQTAYWIQQLFVLALGLEKPRKDFTELILHHIVTIWLIGWSYVMNMTRFGNAIFITMDVSDVFLALAKMFNYLRLEKTSAVTMAFFACLWTYTRHWLNILMLYSTWTEFELIPAWARNWIPEQGVWMAPWVQYQIFIPIFVLQLVNIFWFFLIWRIVIRAVFGSKLEDDRSDDEDEPGADGDGDEKDD